MAPSLLAGRLGDPEMTLGIEPRVNSKLLDALKAHNLDGHSHMPTALTRDSPLDEISAYVLDCGDLLENLHRSMDYTVPGDKAITTEITRSEEYIPGPNGHRVKVIIHRPTRSANSHDPLPSVIYFHGGGMVILTTENPMHMSWVEALTRMGLVTITVDFRNALTRSGANPFPAGLDDCAAVVKWVGDHKNELNISKIVLQGNSGGANLALATAIKANRDGWVGMVDGVYAGAPYISGAYHMSRDWKLQKLPSLVECDDYFLNCHTSALSSKMYDPSEENVQNPLAWPYWASQADLKGLPPHVIVTNELDPLRDEGSVYYRKLVQAGVSAVGRLNLGMIHEGELSFRTVMPDEFFTSLWDIKSFVDRV